MYVVMKLVALTELCSPDNEWIFNVIERDINDVLSLLFNGSILNDEIVGIGKITIL